MRAKQSEVDIFLKQEHWETIGRRMLQSRAARGDLERESTRRRQLCAFVPQGLEFLGWAGLDGHGRGRSAESAIGSSAEWRDNYLMNHSVPNLHVCALGWIDSKKAYLHVSSLQCLIQHGMTWLIINKSSQWRKNGWSTMFRSFTPSASGRRLTKTKHEAHRAGYDTFIIIILINIILYYIYIYE